LTIHSAFKTQAINCHNLDSPFTGRFCDLFSQHLKPDGKVAETLFNWTGDLGPYGASLPLRLAGAFHALVLEGHSRELQAVYPPHHEIINDNQLWNTFQSTLYDHADFILQRLQSPPQTNEVRRSSALVPGFLTIAAQTGFPFVLSEVGASTGLNLLWDCYQFQFNNLSWGDNQSTVKLAPQWSGPMPPDAPVEVLSRAGCDLLPLNAASVDDRARLLSYIWPDQVERIALIRAALDIASNNPPPIAKSDALSWLEQRLATPHTNATHVIYHTIMWQYMSPSDQKCGQDLIAAAGMRATNTAPLAWLRLEADDKEPGAALMLTLWPTGKEQCIGRADFHGRWVNWIGWS
jgi:hypothetical protein